MKKLLRILTAACSTVFVLAIALLVAACGESARKLTFETDGGTQIAPIEAVAGSEIQPPADPVKEGYLFDGWYLTADCSGERVTLPAVMPDEDRTYYAGWVAEESGEGTVAYTVVLYKQTLSLDGYETNAADNVTGEGKIGKYLTLNAPAVTGFREAESDQAVTRLTLSKDASQNVFVFYYDRETYFVGYHSNSPDGSSATGEMAYTEVIYGGTVTVEENAYILQNHRFAGWSLSRNGDVSYTAGDEIVVTGSVMLYAVWDKAYTDRFGGGDNLYLPFREGGVVYLERAGLPEQTGTYDDQTGLFRFEISADSTLQGKLNYDGTYSYFRDAVAGVYTGYDPFRATTGEAKLTLDDYYGATYTSPDGAETAGVYSLEESSGLYLFSAEGETFRFYLSENETESGTEQVFVRRGEEFEWENVRRSLITDPTKSGNVQYYTSDFFLSFDGFGNATYLSGTSSYRYLYSFGTTEDYLFGDELPEGNFIVKLYIQNTNGELTEDARVMIFPLNTFYGYFIYNDAVAGTYETEQGVLSLDGYGVLAKYASAEDAAAQFSYTGAYTAKESAAADYLVRFSDDSGLNVFQFLLTGDAIAPVSLSYGEYSLLSSGLLYYAPYLVLDGTATDTVSGNASLWVYLIYINGTTDYVEATRGIYYYDAERDAYVYEQTEVVRSAYAPGVPDFMVFSFYSTNTLDLYYWKEYSFEGGEVQNNSESYTNGKASLLLEGAGFATYTTADGRTYDGWWTDYTDYIVVDASYKGIAATFYFELNGEEKTFAELESEPRTMVLVTEYRETDETTTLFIDGKGGGIYTVGGTQYTGAYARYGVTAFGAEIYTFTYSAEGTESSFRFLMQKYGDSDAFFRYNEVYAGTYGSESGEFRIDGFGYAASYTDASGNYREGEYYFDAAEAHNGGVLVRFVTDSELFFLDLNENAFSVRDAAYGEYYAYDWENGVLTNVLLAFDGYGYVEYYDYTLDSSSPKYVGEYEADNDAWSVRLYAGGTQICAFTVTLGKVGIASETYCAYLEKEIVEGLYYASDWTTVRLNGYGTAVYTDGIGVRHEIPYQQVSEHYVWFGTDVLYGLYRIDAKTAVYEEVKAEFADENGFIIDGDTLVRYYESVNAYSDVSVPNGITKIAVGAFAETSVVRLNLPGVTEIGEGAFYRCLSLTSVDAGTATIIGNYAFYGCSNVETWNISPDVLIVGDYAFYQCVGLKELSLLKTASVGDYAFYGCTGVGRIGLGELLRTVGDFAFAYTSVTEIRYPDSLVRVGDSSLAGCANLTTLSVPFVGSTVWTEYEKATVIPWYFGEEPYEGGTAVSSRYAIAETYYSTATFYVPDALTMVEIRGGVVKHFACYALTLDKIVFGDKVTAIQKYVCGEVTVSEIVFEAVSGNLTEIQSFAFYHTTGYPTIAIPEGVRTLGDYAFTYQTDLTEISLPSTLETIGSYAFVGCVCLKEIVIPEKVTVIDANTFVGCTTLESVTLSSSTRWIGSSAFERCTALQQIEVPDSVTYIGSRAFFNSALTSFRFPSSLESLGSYAFYYCTALTTVEFSDDCPNLTYLPEFLFYTSSVTSVKIPETVTYIGANAFYRTKLTSVYIPANVAYIGDSAFYDCESLVTAEFAEGGALKRLPDQLFAACKALQEVKIPSNVTTFGTGVFQSCSTLPYLIIPETVTVIEGACFSGSTYLLIICEAASAPEGWAENWNSSELSCTFTGGKIERESEYLYVVKEGKSVLVCHLQGAADVVVPATLGGCPVVEVGYGAFEYDYALATLSFAADSVVETISEKAFKDCRFLLKASLPETLLSIGNSAFISCWGMRTINLPESVVSIEADAFKTCYNTVVYTKLASAPSGWYSTLASGVSKIYYSFGQGPLTDGVFSYTVTENGVKILQATPGVSSASGGSLISAEPLIIPSTLSGYPVTELAAGAFLNLTVPVIYIPATVTSCEAKAISTSANTIAFEADSLPEGFPVSTTSTQNWLYNESTHTVRYSCTVPVIDEETSLIWFESQGNAVITGYVGSDVTVTVPETIGEYPVTAIGAGAFGANTSFNGLVIPKTVTSAGYWALRANAVGLIVYCYADTTLPGFSSGWISLGNTSYVMYKDQTIFSDGTFEYYVDENSSAHITRYVGSGTSVLIPSTLGGSPVTEICTLSFAVDSANPIAPSSRLNVVKFARDSVLTTIGSYAFYSCSSLYKVYFIPETVTSIGTKAFYSARTYDYLYIGFIGTYSLSSSIANNCYYNTQCSYDEDEETWDAFSPV